MQPNRPLRPFWTRDRVGRWLGFWLSWRGLVMAVGIAIAAIAVLAAPAAAQDDIDPVAIGRRVLELFGGEVPLWFLILVGLVNLAGKVIPNTATGALGRVRQVCKVLTLYFPDRK